MLCRRYILFPIYVCIFVSVYVHVCRYACMYIRIKCVYMYVHVRMHICMYDVCVCVCIRIRMLALIIWLVKINFVTQRIKRSLSSSPAINYYSLLLISLSKPNTLTLSKFHYIAVLTLQPPIFY
jgi:hypothetical protein